jgi:hypothetical protein
MGIHALLWLSDGFPFGHLFGVIAHAMYMTLLQRFPDVRITSWNFIASIGMSRMRHTPCTDVLMYVPVI